MIEIFSATRHSKTAFWEKSALGISLRRLQLDTRIKPRIAFDNRRGLSELYNERIKVSNGNEYIVFIHDDVWIDDYFIANRIIEGLNQFDVIGVAGNTRISPKQPGWAFLDTNWTWDDRANLSGAIAAGKGPFGAFNFYGPTPAKCELMDGVFFAAKKSVLIANNVFFDPQFDFHFYDLDFCRTARKQGLIIGTWPICLTHIGDGSSAQSENWRKKLALYFSKWES